MRILFVHTVFDYYTSEHPMTSYQSMQMGVSYISSYLKQRGHVTQLVVLPSSNTRISLQTLAAYVERYQPEVVAFTAVSTQYAFVRIVAAYLRQNWPKVFLVAGGVHVSMRPAEAICDPFDAVCIGEGEEPLLEMVQELAAGRQPKGIKNLWIRRDDGSIEKNPTRAFLNDLDVLPFPDRDMWGPWIHNEDSSQHTVLLGRGCPYLCTYCCNHILRRLASGKYVRYRSVDNILSEIEWLRKQYPKCSSIYFEIETILLDREWVISLCTALKAFNETSGKPFSYSCNLRICPQAFGKDLYKALRDANFTAVFIGLESGSERLRNEVLKRDYSNADFLKVVELAKSHGLDVNLYNMVGLPTETPADHEETIRLNREVSPRNSGIFIFYPYPGTDLYEFCIDKGWLKVWTAGSFMERRRACLDFPAFSKREIQKAYYLFEWRIYNGTRSFNFRLGSLVKNYISINTNYFFNRLFHQLIFAYSRAKLAIGNKL